MQRLKGRKRQTVCTSYQATELSPSTWGDRNLLPRLMLLFMSFVIISPPHPQIMTAEAKYSISINFPATTSLLPYTKERVILTSLVVQWIRICHNDRLVHDWEESTHC